MAADPCPSHTAMVRLLTQDRLTAMSVSLSKATAVPLGDAVHARYDDASALTLLDEADEAFDALQAAFERAPDNLTVLRRLTDAALLAGRFADALSLCATWDKLSPDSAMPHRGTIEALVMPRQAVISPRTAPGASCAVHPPRDGITKRDL